MGLARGLSTISTKRRKVKLTKAKLQELELQWRQHNRDMKRKGLHDLRYDTLQQYIDYCYGRTKINTEFKPYKAETNWRSNDNHRQLYPSAPLNAPDGRGTAKPTQKYTGDLIVGIATMHKSNAVPVMKGTKQAEEIAKMRRG
jgi:hypothetical protein